MKTKGQAAMQGIISALVIFFMVYIAIMIVGQVDVASSYNTCVANHTSHTVTGCNLDWNSYQMMNSTDKNSSSALSLSGILPVVLIAAALVMAVLGFIIKSR